MTSDTSLARWFDPPGEALAQPDDGDLAAALAPQHEAGQTVQRPLVRPVADTSTMRLALERAASRWTLDVVVALQHGPQRYSDVRSATGASSQGLTRVLRSMERDGLVTRTEKAGAASWVEYALSPLGASLCDVVSTLREWAESNGEAVHRARVDYDQRNALP